MIYEFLATGFEEIEAVSPIDILRRAGLKVTTVGIGGRNVTGSHGITITADISDDDFFCGNDIEAIVFPGGMPGTLNLEKSDTVQSAIDYCVKERKYIAAVCAAPIILGHKGILAGKKATCFPGYENDLTGAKATGLPTVTDGIFITGKSAGCAREFALGIVSALCGREKAEKLRTSLVCE